MNENTISYLMLFCALILVKNSRATLEQSLSAVPLFGSAKALGSKLTAHPNPVPAQAGHFGLEKLAPEGM